MTQSCVKFVRNCQETLAVFISVSCVGCQIEKHGADLGGELNLFLVGGGAVRDLPRGMNR